VTILITAAKETKRNDAITAFFSSQLTKLKTVRKFLWPLLVVNLSIPGLI